MLVDPSLQGSDDGTKGCVHRRRPASHGIEPDGKLKLLFVNSARAIRHSALAHLCPKWPLCNISNGDQISAKGTLNSIAPVGPDANVKIRAHAVLFRAAQDAVVEKAIDSIGHDPLLFFACAARDRLVHRA